MQNAQQGIIAGGDIYFDFLTAAGASQGFNLAGNVNKFIPKVETEALESTLNGRDTLGQIGDSYTRITASTIQFSMNRYDPKIVAAFFAGSAVDMTAAAGNYTATVTAILDQWIPFEEYNGDTCVVKDETDTTTYVAKGDEAEGEEPDYEVNLRLGMIKPLSTGSITSAAVLHLSGTTAAASGSKITGGTNPVINCGIMMDGKNYVNGNDLKLRIWKAQIRASGDFDLLAQEGFPVLEFTGTMITPTGKTWPFEML